MQLERVQRADGVALVGWARGRVRFAFTERTGGVSEAPYASLNLGTHVGDDPVAVEENRRRVLAALGVEDALPNLLVPNQVHGDRVVTVTPENASTPEALSAIRADIAGETGADAIVCTVPNVPVLLCFADCVPVILTCGDAFAVVHSGWKGTYARIAAKAAKALATAANRSTSDIAAFIGPHILGDEYQVSADLLQMFSEQFANIEKNAERTLDLSACIRQSLEEVGVLSCEIHDPRLSTVRQNDRFFSYRAEQGTCGRHAAVACIR